MTTHSPTPKASCSKCGGAGQVSWGHYGAVQACEACRGTLLFDDTILDRGDNLARCAACGGSGCSAANCENGFITHTHHCRLCDRITMRGCVLLSCCEDRSPRGEICGKCEEEGREW